MRFFMQAMVTADCLNGTLNYDAGELILQNPNKIMIINTLGVFCVRIAAYI